MCDEVNKILVKWTLVSIILTMILGSAIWWFRADVPPFLATIPASGFTLLGAMWQVKAAVPSDSPAQKNKEEED